MMAEPRIPIRKPAFPEVLTPESLEQYKKDFHKYDAARLAAGASRDEIQRENSMVKDAEAQVTISTFDR